MVATASPAAQNMEAERRRKLTIERAKANHVRGSRSGYKFISDDFGGFGGFLVAFSSVAT